MPTGSDRSTPAQRFGTLVERLATQAGFDMARGGTGRARLAEATGMSVSAVGRMVRGETLPDPASYQRIAQAVNVHTRSLLVAADLLPDEEDRNGANQDVLSVTHPLSPEAVADMYGITNPTVREMFIADIHRAVRLQRDLDQHGTHGGPAVARG
ncbi:helix-turn-helix domain-containing protein [Streptomyces mirabilis]|uniref:helix-turn-helix domain-containing protein n=1 Tax=Streptomyces mirabilis TaxID=68239 RepID=UPI00332F2A80